MGFLCTFPQTVCLEVLGLDLIKMKQEQPQNLTPVLDEQVMAIDYNM
jgi:hypothetical protein